MESACQGRVLLVDDRLESRELVADELEELGLQVTQAADGNEGWERFAESSFDLVITDLRMPHSDGLDLLRRIRSPHCDRPSVPVVLLSAFGTLPVADEAGGAGATAFYSYDPSGIGQLKSKVLEILRKPLNGIPVELLGQSLATVELRGQLLGYANSGSVVLLYGEVGSGRSAAARFIHDSSRRAIESFYTVNAGDLISADHPGDGTIYLSGFDAFSDAERNYWLERIVDIESNPARCILLSMSRDLGLLVPKNLSRFRVDLQPLRKRTEDFPELVSSLWRQLGQSHIPIDRLAFDAFRAHNWYENFTELREVLESIAVRAKGQTITSERVKVALAQVRGPLSRIASAEATKERDRLIELWTEHLSYTGVGTALGITRNAAKYRMKKFNLVPGRGGLPK